MSVVVGQKKVSTVRELKIKKLKQKTKNLKLYIVNR